MLPLPPIPALPLPLLLLLPQPAECGEGEKRMAELKPMWSLAAPKARSLSPCLAAKSLPSLTMLLLLFEAVAVTVAPPLLLPVGTALRNATLLSLPLLQASPLLMLVLVLLVLLLLVLMVVVALQPWLAVEIAVSSSMLQWETRKPPKEENLALR
jgi:hypothetical protein